MALGQMLEKPLDLALKIRVRRGEIEIFSEQPAIPTSQKKPAACLFLPWNNQALLFEGWDSRYTKQSNYDLMSESRW